MALQIRRGTDSQRQGITPAEGELIYTTDTDKLYIGDGSTAGGIEISGGTDSAAISAIISASSIDAAQLDGQNPSYYLDYGNLTNVPTTQTDSSTVDSIVLNLVDSSYVQARETAQDFSYASLTGTPTIPTNNNELTNGAAYVTQTAVDSAVTALIGGAPGALDTLNELAAAINDDASFASSITTNLGTKLNKAGDTLTGTLVSQHIQPTTDDTYDLGSPTKRYRDLYLGPGSLYVNNKKVIEDDAGTITVKTDSDQNLSIKTLGTGQTTLQSAAGLNLTSTGSADISLTTSTGQIELNGDVILNASNSINSSNSNPINFGDNIDLNSNKIVNIGTPTNVTDAVNKTYVDNLDISTFTNDAGYLTSYTETNDLSSAVTWANVPNANITQGSVTQHQAALSITESQISDLQSYLTSVPAQSFASLTSKPTTLAGYGITDAFDGAYGSLSGAPNVLDSSDVSNIAGGLSGLNEAGVTALVDSDYVQSRETTQDFAYSSLTGAPTIPSNNNQLTNGAGYITGYTVTQSDVTGHQSALSITESQISDLQSYLTSYTVTQSDVTGHQAALSITESQISDLGTYLTSSSLTNYRTATQIESMIDSNVNAIVDAAPGALDTLNELAAALGDDANFSTTITTQIAGKLDSAQAIATITGSDLDMGGNKVLFGNVYSQTSDLPLASSYHGMFAHVHATGAAYFAHNGNWIQLANNSDINSFDGAYSSLTGKPTILDSADVTSIAGSGGGVDSAAITEMIDSAYVQARQSGGGGGSFSPSSLNRSLFTFTATANQTVFTGTAGSGGTLSFNNEVDVYINGILLDASDYTLSGGNTLTLASGTGVNNIVTIIDYGATGLTLPSLKTYEYTANANQTTFSGSDDNNETLAYSIGKYNVYLNGILLKNTNDYTATNGTSVVLQSGVNAGDVLQIVAWSEAAVATLDSDGVTNLIDASYINGLDISAGLDSSAVTNLIDASYIQSNQTAQDFAYSSLSGTPTIPTNNNQLTNGAGYITGYTVTQSDVTGHQAALSITESQISDLGTYLTSSDLSTYATQTYVTNAVNNVIDAAPGALDTLNELAAALGDDANFSTTITTQIANKLDSAQAIATITSSDLDMNGNKVLFGNVYTAQSDLPSASSYHGMFAHVHNDGAGYFAHAGNWVRLANQSEIPSVVDSAGVSAIITADVDAAFVNALGISAGVDSAGISSIITADVDAAFVTALGFTAGSGSATTSDGIDTTYVYTATAGQTAFTGSDDNSATLSYTANSVMVYLNGILLIPTTDYTATNGTTVTLVSGAAVNDELMIVTVKSGPKTWTEESGSYIASAGDKLFVDVSSAIATVTLPASPSMGDEVRVIDATGNCATNNITINRNGNNINGVADDLVLNINRSAIGLAYYNSTQGWVLIER